MPLRDEMFRVLMGDKVEPRRLFIEKHALEVRNLDVKRSQLRRSGDSKCSIRTADPIVLGEKTAVAWDP